MRKIISLILALSMLVSFALPMTIGASANTGVVLSVSEATGQAGDIVDITVNVNADSGMVGMTLSLVYDPAKLEFQMPTGNAAAIRNAFTTGTLCAGIISMFSANHLVADSKVKVSITLDEEIFGAGSLAKFRFLIKDSWYGDTPLTLVQAPTDTVIIDDALENIPFSTVAGKISVPAPTYQITFDANGGVGGEVQTVTEGDTPVPPTVTRTGYTFEGWSPTIAPAAADATYTAQWTKVVTLTVSDASGGVGDIVDVFVNVDAGSGMVGMTLSLVYDPAKLEFQMPTGNAAAIRNAFTTGTLCEGIISMFSANHLVADSKVKVSITLDEEIFGAGSLAKFRFLIKDGWTGDTPLTLVKAPTDTVIIDDSLANIPFVTEDGKVTFVAVTYQITFDANGGSGGEVQTVNQGSIPAPPTVSRPGYTFAGWTPTIVAATADTTYTAQWTINAYEITFDANGGEGGEVVNVNFGTVPVAPIVTREGYSFAGWTPDIVEATEDATYTAQWTINQYTITLDANGGICPVGSITQDFGTQVSNPPDPTRTGYYFTGWNPTVPTVMPAENTTCVAQWTPNSYMVVFNANGGTGYMADQPIEFDDSAALQANMYTFVGRTFTGWNTAADGSGDAYADGADYTMVTEGATLYAQWALNTYQITFDANGGTGGAVLTVPYGTVPVPPIVERTGYSFVDWDPTPVVEATQDATYTAQWVANQYTITFDSDGGSAVAPITQDYNTAVTAPANPTKAGYTFAGWLPVVPTTMPASNTTCVAQWTVNQYTITFDSDGGSAVAPITQDFGTAVTAPANPTKTGYTFAGWLPVVPTTMPASNTTCVAQWTVNQYTITFDSAGGSAVAPITQDFGTAVTAPVNPTKAGYTFAGWLPVVPTTMPASNTTCVAQWTVNTYQIIFDATGGEGGEVQTVDYGTLPVAPTVTRTGYAFAGWTPEIVAATEDATYTAQWTINTYQITFDANNGTGTSVQTVNHGDVPVAPTVTRTGYTFNGWTPAIVAATANATYTAQWTINTYQITFNANGGEGGEVQTVNYGTVPVPPTVTQAGFTFNGWTPEIVAATEDTTYTATWLINYTVTFNSNGGTAVAPIIVPFGGIINKPEPDPTKAGNTFAGWFWDEGLTNEVQWPITIPDDQPASGVKASAQDTNPQLELVLYAAWELNTYEITFDAAGGEGGEVQTVDYGTLPVAPTVTRAGYTFAGWTPDIVVATADATYTAQWTAITYQITFDANGGEGGTVLTVNEGDIPVAPTVTRDGYTFVEWTPAIVAATADATYTAVWEEIPVVTYQIAFDANGGEGGTVLTVDEGTVPVPPVVTREGYTFVEWTPEIVAATEDATYTAVWEEIPVGQTTITFNSAGGSAVSPITGDIGSPVTAPADPTREGYTFMGWSPALPETFPAEDLEVTALWNVNTYYAIFMVDGEEYAKVPVDFGGVITPPEAPEKEGYIFEGWDSIPDTMPANDVVINALFTEDGVPNTGSNNAVTAAIVLLAVSVATLSAARIAKKEDEE